MNKDKARWGIYALAGVYLLHLAYEMFQQLSTAGSDRIIMIVFIVLFVIIGIGLIGLSLLHMWKRKS